MLDISNYPWASCTLTEERTLRNRDSLSLSRSQRDRGVHRYGFELITIDMDMTLGRKVKARLSRATKDTLTFVHPRLSYSQGTVPESGIKVKGAEVLGINQKGLSEIYLTSTEEWQLMAGDHIQLFNDTKVYEVAEDTDLLIGDQEVLLTSPLRVEPTNNSVVTANGVTWHLKSSGVIEVEMDASDNQDMELTLITVEAL